MVHTHFQHTRSRQHPSSDKSTLFFIFTPSSGPRPWLVWAVTTVLALSVGCSTCMCISIGGLRLHVVGVACCVGMLLRNLTVLKRPDVEVGIADWNVMGKWNDGLNEKGRHGCGRAVSSSTISVGQQSGCFCDCWNVSCKLLICRFLVCLCVSVFSVLVYFFVCFGFVFCLWFPVCLTLKKKAEKKAFSFKSKLYYLCEYFHAFYVWMVS